MTVKEQLLNGLPGALINTELLDSIRNLKPQQLNWLSGYCAGLLAYQSENHAEYEEANLAVSSLAPQSARPVLVLYASQTGNAQSVAEQLFDSLHSSSIATELKSTLAVSAKELAGYSAILLVTSTHGEGEPPDDAVDFYDELISKKLLSKGEILEGIDIAVLGLGDSSYEFFCQTAKDMLESFKKLGAQELTEIVFCDVDYEQRAKQWIEQVSAAVISKVNELETRQAASKSTVGSLDSNVRNEKINYDKDNPYKASIDTIQRITGRGSPKETYHVEIDISGSGIVYEPGDALGIIVHNRSELVNEIIELLHLSGDTQVKYRNQQLTLIQFLTEIAELTLINKSTVQALIELSQNEKLQKIYEDNFNNYIKDHQLIDLLLIAKPNISEQRFVDILKPKKPRLYSIASSQRENPDEVHLTLNHVSINNENGIRYGLASHYLTQQLEEGQSVNVFVERNPKFKLPLTDSPIIMVGPGTGIAPFRSFLQERSAKNSAGKNWLLFGNPYFNTDFLYQVEIQKYVNSGVLSKLDLAFSRDSNQKVYVQHKLLERASDVWEWLEQGAYFYVCGDMHTMGKEVEQALLTIIQQQGQRNFEEAKQYLKDLKVQQRYQRDVY